jgi:hypothetical protein
MTVKRSDKILVSKEEIKVYLGNVSDRAFRRYVEQGMPARYDDGAGWMAHTDNLDKFFQMYTGVNSAQVIRKLPDD